MLAGVPDGCASARRRSAARLDRQDARLEARDIATTGARAIPRVGTTFAQTVYVTEGETDAIALIDAGIETDPGTIAVAIPSASTFNEEWVQLFRSKDVVLAFDADDAGQGATLKVSKLLLPFVRSLKANQMGGTTTCLLVPPKTSAIFIKVSGARTWFER